MKRVSIITGTLLIITGLYFYFNEQIERFFKIKDTVSISNVKVEKISIKKIKLKIWLLFNNKTNFDATIDSYDFDIYINDKYISNVKNNKSFHVKPEGYNEVMSDVSFDPRRFFDSEYVIKLISYFSYNPEKVNIYWDGVVNVRINNIPFSVNIADSTNLKEV